MGASLAPVLLVLLVVASASGTARADIAIATLIPFADKSEIRDSIREECGLSSKLSKSIVKRGAKKQVTLVRVGNFDEAREEGVDPVDRLELRITDAIQTSGGILPTHSLSIDGVLKQDGRIVATMVGTRFARASFIPFRRGECAILAEAVRLLSKDVIRWVKKPSFDARLGDAR